jgi:four helix bundle protein
MDLETWRVGHELVVGTYTATKCFPIEERFGLVTQMRRCSVSITSNIAEGFSRHTGPDKIRFYSIASGSVSELQNQLVVAKDVGYLTIIQFHSLFDLAIRVHKLINGIIQTASTYQIPSIYGSVRCSSIY